MESGIKRTQRDYTLAFKLAVVEQVEKGELTYKQAQQRYGIQGRSTVLVWLRKHGRQGWSNAASPQLAPCSAKLSARVRVQWRDIQGCVVWHDSVDTHQVNYKKICSEKMK